MSQSDIQTAIRQSKPFKPLELILSTGERVTIPHPDAALVGKTTTGVLIDGHIHLIANLHITRIAQLEMSTAS